MDLDSFAKYYNYNPGRMWGSTPNVEVDVSTTYISGNILPNRLINNGTSFCVFISEDYAFLNEALAERFGIPRGFAQYRNIDPVPYKSICRNWGTQLSTSPFGTYANELPQPIGVVDPEEWYRSIYNLYNTFKSYYTIFSPSYTPVPIKWNYQFPGETVWPLADDNLPPQGSTTKSDYGGTQTFIKVNPNPVVQSSYTHITPISFTSMIQDRYDQSPCEWDVPQATLTEIREYEKLMYIYRNLRSGERFLADENSELRFDCEWDYYKQDPQAAQSQTAGVFYRPIRYQEYHYKLDDVQPNLGLISGTLREGFNKTNGDLPGNTVYRIKSICGNTYADPAMDYKYPWFVTEDTLFNDFAFMYPIIRVPVNQCTCVCHFVIYHFKNRMSIHGGGYSNGTYQQVDVFFPLKPIEFELVHANTNSKHRLCKCISNVYKTKTEYERGLPRGGDMGLCIDWKQWLGQNGYTFLTQNVANVDTSDASQPYYDIHSSYGWHASESDATNRNEIIWVDLASVDVIYRFNGRTKLRNVQWP